MVLYLDNHDYKFYRKDRGFALDKFKINYKIIGKKFIKNYRYIPFTKIDFFIMKYLQLNGYKKKNLILKENESENLKLILKKIKPNMYIEGYWQNIDFIKNVKPVMQKEIELKEKSSLIERILNKINLSNSCSIHVRRGDYLLKPFSEIYHVCSEKYYQNAIKIIENKISNPHFFIFSDDIKWIKNKFTNLKNKTFISDYNLTDYEEFFLLSKCKNHIISNSTFSLIGAWINSGQNTIIEPSRWFKKKSSGNKIIKEWIKLEN